MKNILLTMLQIPTCFKTTQLNGIYFAMLILVISMTVVPSVLISIKY